MSTRIIILLFTFPSFGTLAVYASGSSSFSLRISPSSVLAIIKDFEKFFEDMPSDALSEVIAVAMDMNASYNKLVTQHLQNAQIVYDRFHMQSQFGRDVLGVVRLDEARKHKAKSKEILADITNDTDKDTKQAIKRTIQS